MFNDVPHVSVLLKEVISYLLPKKDALYVDATFGAGGYSEAILKHAECKVIGIDCDYTAQAFADSLKSRYQGRFSFAKSNFVNIGEVLKSQGISSIDGVVFDLGVSSMQLSNKERGFSFNYEARLDMRMDEDLSLTAEELLNSYSEERLSKILYEYGGEKMSRQIAKSIVRFRKNKKIEKISELLDIIKKSFKRYNDTIHYATRTFQALRIAVNKELESLEKALMSIPQFLAHNGVIVVVSFHSGEDAIVKSCFANLESQGGYKLLLKNYISPSNEERAFNNRSRSAKLRAIQKIL